MEIYSAGFTEWSAEQFFGALTENQIQRLIDVRLRPNSQLAGFAKQRDFRFFLKTVCGIEYEHRLELAPTKDLLNAYRSNSIPWNKYEDDYLDLIRSRAVESIFTPNEFTIPTVLMCSEHKPEKCHRRVAIEYLNQSWSMKIEIVHIT